MKRTNDIDVGLDILCLLSKPGQILSHRDIAEVCGCTGNYIDELEKRALNKMRQKMNRDDYLEDSR